MSDWETHETGVLYYCGVCPQGEIALLTDAPRLATVRAEENCSVMEISRQHFLTMFANQSKSAVADFELKLFRHNCELHHVIHHRRGIECFTDALKKEFSAENIEVRLRLCSDGAHNGKDARTVEDLCNRPYAHWFYGGCLCWLVLSVSFRASPVLESGGGLQSKL